MIKRFVDWMEASPAYKTIWFIPLLLVLYVYALIKNQLQRINMPKRKYQFLARLFRRNAKPDDNIERHEPDRIIPVFMDFLFGIVITAFLAMLAYAFMTDALAVWIAHFIAAQPNPNGYNFDERLAAFTASVIVLANMVIIFGVALTRTPDNEDVVEAIGDLGEEIDERFAEIENRFSNEIDQVRKTVDDLTPGNEDEFNERLVRAVGD